MIQVKSLSLTFAHQVIFDDISLQLSDNQHIGVVGRNGSGKSTLLKLIAGQMQPDAGSVTIEKQKRLAYMPQDMVMLSDKTVYDEAFFVFAEFVAYEKELAELEHEFQQSTATSSDHIERYQELQEKIKAFNKPSALHKTETILKGLGFTQAMQQQKVTQLSVGWKMRLILAKLLLMDADFYLFDEPTNHLDMTSKVWFFQFLQQARFGYLLVTHDRYFLEHASDFILELERGKATLYRGNFSSYLEQKEQRQTTLKAAYDRQQREIEKKEALIDRFRAKASKAAFAQSLMKQLDKIERIEIEPALPVVSFSFPQAQRSGEIVVRTQQLKKSFGNHVIFDRVFFEIARGEKVAIVAPNGTGKTTLFNVITGKIPADSGTVSFGHNVQSAIFEQDQLESLNPNDTVFQTILNACPHIPESTIRSFLGSFLFSGDEIKKKISFLSGGERNRVAMVKVLLQKANFLLLDEPTNHLDLYAKDVLLKALQTYSGTILFVSHDLEFLSTLATRILELSADGIVSYPGNYDTYLQFKKNAQQPTSEKISAKGESKQDQPAKQQFFQRKEIAALESKIARLEKEIEKLNAQLLNFEYGTTEYQKLFGAITAAQKQLDESLAQWEILQSS